MKILLATDGSWCSLVAVREVAQRPWPHGTEVKLLHVSKHPVTHQQEQVDALPAKVRSHLYSSASDAIDKALAQFSSSERPDLSVDAEVLPGQPARVIVAEAERWGADLVVVGAHGMGRADRALLGSVSRQVASNASARSRLFEPGLALETRAHTRRIRATSDVARGMPRRPPGSSYS